MNCLASFFVLSQLVLGQPSNDLFGDPLPAGVTARFGTDRMRDAGFLTSLSFVDGARLLSSSQGNIVRMWQVDDGREIAQFTCDEGVVMSIGLSPDHRSVYASTRAGSFYQWDIDSGKRLHAEREIGSLSAMTPSVTAITTLDGIVKLLKPDLTLITTFQPDTYHAADMVLSADYRFLASLRFNRARALKRENDDQAGPITTLAIYSVADQEELHYLSVEDDAQDAVCFSGDSSTLYVGGRAGVIRIVDVATGEFTGEFAAHDEGILALAWDPTRNQLISGSRDGTIRVWDPETKKELRRFEAEQAVARLAVAPDGSRLASSSGAVIEQWDLETGEQPLPMARHTGVVSAVKLIDDGKRLLSGSYDSMCRLWDAKSGKGIRAYRGHLGFVNAVDYDATRGLMASASNDGAIRLWDVETGKLTRLLSGHKAAVSDVIFSADGSRTFSVSSDQTIRAWDTESGDEIYEVEGQPGALFHIDLAPDGETFVVVGSKVRIHQASSGARLAEVDIPPGLQTAVAYSPDGRWIAAASVARKIRMIETENFTVVSEFAIPLGRPLAVAFSPDSDRIAVTNDRDGTISFFPLSEDGKEKTTRLGESPIYSLDWDHASGRIAVGTLAGMAYTIDP